MYMGRWTYTGITKHQKTLWHVLLRGDDSQVYRKENLTSVPSWKLANRGFIYIFTASIQKKREVKTGVPTKLGQTLGLCSGGGPFRGAEDSYIPRCQYDQLQRLRCAHTRNPWTQLDKREDMHWTQIHKDGSTGQSSATLPRSPHCHLTFPRGSQ